MKVILFKPTWKRPLLKVRSILTNSEYTDCIVEVYDETYTAKRGRIVECTEADYIGMEAVLWKCGERIKAGKFIKRGYIKKNRCLFDMFDWFKRDSLRLGYEITCIYRNHLPQDKFTDYQDIIDLMPKQPRKVEI